MPCILGNLEDKVPCDMYSEVVNGLAFYFLDMEIDSESVTSQKKYALNPLNQFGFKDCKPMPTHISTNFKLNDEAEKFKDINWYQSADLQYVVGLLCRFISSPTVEHVHLVKPIFRYIKGITSYGLRYTKSNNSSSYLNVHESNKSMFYCDNESKSFL